MSYCTLMDESLNCPSIMSTLEIFNIQTSAREPCIAFPLNRAFHEICTTRGHWVRHARSVAPHSCHQALPSQPSLQCTLKRSCRKFEHIVVQRGGSPPLRSIDGCPVSLSRGFRKHQRLSDEVLTKGQRVAMRGEGG